MTGKPLSKWAVLALVFAAGVAVDQWTKYLAVTRLTSAVAAEAPLGRKLATFYGGQHFEPWTREPHVVWKPMWRMRYAENRAAAFGLFIEVPERLRIPLFGVLVLGATVFILWYYRRLEPGQRLAQVPLAMILAGAHANYLDRLTHGFVIDFVDWHWWNRPDLYWPTFNVADALIVVGVITLLLLPQEKAPEKA